MVFGRVFYLMPKTYYWSGLLASGSNHHAFVEVAPVTANFSTGWVVNGVPANEYSEMVAGAERGAGSFTTTVKPVGVPNNALGDSFRTEETLYGTFEAGTWDMDMYMISLTSAGPGGGSLVMKIFKGTDPTGANATQMKETFGFTGFGNSLSPILCTSSPSVGDITLYNEYLFIQVAYRINTKGDNAGMDAHLRQTSLGRIITPEFYTMQNTSFAGLGDSDLYEPPSAALFEATPGDVDINMTSLHAISDVALVENTVDSEMGPVDITPDDFEVSPVVPDDLNVSYNASETTWRLGEYLI